MSSEVTPAISEAVIKDYFGRARKYIRENGQEVPDREITSEDISQKPFLYQECQVKQAGNCPSGSSSRPACHSCIHAGAAIEVVNTVVPDFGFIPGEPESYPGIGSKGVCLSRRAGKDTAVVDISGDDGGFISVSLHPTRRPKKS
jgi:hypothetical protein